MQDQCGAFKNQAPAHLCRKHRWCVHVVVVVVGGLQKLHFPAGSATLTPPVFCCLTSRAEAKPPSACGSSYFTLSIKNERIQPPASPAFCGAVVREADSEVERCWFKSHTWNSQANFTTL